MCWLLWLRKHGSGMWPLYVQLLPREEEMCSLMNFTPEQRRELQCPNTEALAEQARLHVAQQVVQQTEGGAEYEEHALWLACKQGFTCEHLLVLLHRVMA
eukprot:GHRQ01032562.1.p2 GENE.GHRQ01032562.1~~GHRQ01032562.1.p2  ORF type:complete len:100 (+),score=25.30 GHRQ01032562.1:298-597(+)